ncbi:MAG: T9SS type A sorting domain-containing protein [Dysgonamonadaceae bacterium]|jgi:hypothetical protein|nr:T9SS type A sorting domain-containing protein [Dysgonamonadaceae bacterium]
MKKIVLVLLTMTFVFTENIWAEVRLNGYLAARDFGEVEVGTSKLNSSGTTTIIGINGEEISYQITNNDGDPATVFTVELKGSSTYYYFANFGFTPLAAKAYVATLTVFADGIPLSPTITLTGTGVEYPIFNFGSARTDLPQVKRIAVDGLTEAIDLEKVQITNNGTGNNNVFTKVAAAHYDTGDSIDVQFAPKDAIEYSATLSVANTPKVILKGKGSSTPRSSSADNAIWYYIQFVSGEKVVQQNGAGFPLTAQTRVDGKESQLWKALPGEASSGSHILFYNKQNPNLRIHFHDNGYYATDEPAVNSPYEDISDAVILNTLFSQTTTNYTNLTWGPEGHDVEYYPAKPENTGEGSRLVINGNRPEDFPKTYLRFIYYSETGVAGINPVNTGNKTKVYPNPANEILFIELEEPAIAISVINSAGQTVSKILPKSKLELFSTINLGTGIYLLKIERSSEIERVKFIKK